MCRYLNPNTLLLVVGLPAGAAPVADATTPAKLTAVVLDAVTGRVLFSQAHEVGWVDCWAVRPGSDRCLLMWARPLLRERHSRLLRLQLVPWWPQTEDAAACTHHTAHHALLAALQPMHPQGATGPVHAVLSENMAAYHFWSVDSHRWQMAAVELYDASPTTLRCAAGACCGACVAFAQPAGQPLAGSTQAALTPSRPQNCSPRSRGLARPSLRPHVCRVSDLAFSVPNVTASSWDAPPVEAAATTLLT